MWQLVHVNDLRPTNESHRAFIRDYLEATQGWKAVTLHHVPREAFPEIPQGYLIVATAAAEDAYTVADILDMFKETRYLNVPGTESIEFKVHNTLFRRHST